MKIKPGDFITITERKCSDKVQPHIKLNGIYHVNSLDHTKDGTVVLILDRNIDEGTTVRINAHRFTWHSISKKEILARQHEKQKREKDAILNKALDNKWEEDKKLLLTKFSFDEQTRISYIPLIIYNIAWMYAENCTKYSAEHRIEEVKKLSRTVKMLRDKYVEYLSKDLDPAHQNQILRQSKLFIQEHQMDFTILFHSTLNTINHQHVGISYDELRTWAYLSMQMIKSCRKFEDDMTELIRKRLRRADDVHLPYQDELYGLMDAYLGDFAISETQEMQIAMKIFRKNIDNIHYTVTND